MTISLRILVVDDHPDITDILCMQFELMGHRCSAAHEGRTGIEIHHAVDPDIAIIDIGLPDISGYEVARAIRAANPRAFLVALTGWGEPSDITRAREAGFDRHLLKPVDSALLREIVSEAARGRGEIESEGSAFARSRSTRERRAVSETPDSPPAPAEGIRR